MTAAGDMLRAALDAHAAGLAVIPPRADGTKAPIIAWREYQTRRPGETTIRHWYDAGVTGIGLVCGAVSGGLEMLEWEGRAQHLFDAWIDRCYQAGLEDLVGRVVGGYCEVTPSGGVHLLWRCAEIEGNQKLARRRNADGSVEVLIETRGEGGYVIVAPSHGSVHPTGGAWEILQGGFATIATITPEERHALLEIARSFDEAPERQARDHHHDTRHDHHDGDRLRPGDWFTANTTWQEILEPHGWVPVFTHGDETYWRRPGKTSGVSATTNVHGSDLLWVFTTSTPFDAEVSYTRFAAWAVLEHGGDYSAAARAARDRMPPALNGHETHEAPPPATTGGQEAHHEPGGTDHRQQLITALHAALRAASSGEGLDAALQTLIDTATRQQAGPSSWDPTPVAPLMTALAAGTIERPVHEIGHVDGTDTRLIPAGRVSSLVGKGGDGKSMVSQVIAAQELEAGHVVYVVDYEDDALGLAERLLALGVDINTVERQLRYINPTDPLDLATRTQLCQRLTDDRATLVIVDSTGEAMATEQVESSHRDEQVARWFSHYARPLASTGAAVLLIDHLPHDSPKERLAAIGSIRKYNAINGASYLVQPLAEFGRDRVGRSRLVVAKDRLGHRPRGSAAAEFTLDATTTPYRSSLTLPAYDTNATGPLADEKPAVRRVWQALSSDPTGVLTVRELGTRIAADGTTGTGLKTRTIQDALTRLETLGMAAREDSGGPSRWYVRTDTPETEKNCP